MRGRLEGGNAERRFTVWSPPEWAGRLVSFVVHGNTRNAFEKDGLGDYYVPANTCGRKYHWNFLLNLEHWDAIEIEIWSPARQRAELGNREACVASPNTSCHISHMPLLAKPKQHGP